MSLLGRLVGQQERSATTTTLRDPASWLVQALGGGSSIAGQAVSVDGAMGIAPFYRGVQVLSGSVGMLPCKVYRHTSDGGREDAPRSSRAWQLLHDKPNPNMASDEFWALVESHLDTWGNAYVFKERAGDNRIANLWPIRSDRIAVLQEKSGVLHYVLDGNPEMSYTAADILHIRGSSSNGVIGYSPVHLHRNTLGSAMAMQEFEGNFWANDATPGVTLIHPGSLQRDDIERIKALWDGSHKGSKKARTTAVLGEDMKVQQMTMPLRDAQFIENKRFSATEIANILGVPPYMIGGSIVDSLTYSTTEGQSVDFLKFSLAPRLVRIQNAITWDKDLMPSNWYAEFETGAILRTTTAERYKAWSLAPHLTVNDMRRMDNLSPLDGGDVLPGVKAAPSPADPNAVPTGG